MEFGNDQNICGWFEFSYNNSYHLSIEMVPLEALYDRSCRLPLCWTKLEDYGVLEPKDIQDTTDTISMIKKNIQATQNFRQKLCW